VSRFGRSLAIVGAIIGLLSCDIFFAAKSGRYNPLDPENEFVEVFPVVVGEANDSGWMDTGDFVATSSMSPQAAIVMRFNVGEIPDAFEQLYLRLYKSAAGPSGVAIRVHAILQSRLPVDYADTQSGPPENYYYDWDTYEMHEVSEEAGYQLIPLDKIVDESKENIRYGIIIFSESDYVEFQARDYPEPACQPRLYVATK